MDNKTFPSSGAILQVLQDEYTKERERATIVDNKAIALITILLALLTIFIPLIHFEKFMLIINGKRTQAILVTIVAALMVIVLILSVRIFMKLIRAISFQEFHRVDIKELDREEYMRGEESVIIRGLCDHYYKITSINANIIESKIEEMNGCFSGTVIVFGLMVLGTVILSLVK